jgi:hypothetical protein
MRACDVQFWPECLWDLCIRSCQCRVERENVLSCGNEAGQFVRVGIKFHPVPPGHWVEVFTWAPYVKLNADGWNVVHYGRAGHLLTRGCGYVVVRYALSVLNADLSMRPVSLYAVTMSSYFIAHKECTLSSIAPWAGGGTLMTQVACGLEAALKRSRPGCSRPSSSYRVSSAGREMEWTSPSSSTE